VVRVARLVGHEVEVQNYIDDTGRQAAEALEALHVLSTPPQDGEKYDHYVGRLYVEINARLSALPALREELAKLEREGADGRRVELERQCAELEKLQQGVEEMLHELEKGGHRKTIERILDAQLQTATRLGIFYDLLVWESDIVRANLLQQALDLLRQSPRVYVPSSGPHAGALVIELPEPATAKKRRGGDSNDAAQATAEREPNTRVLVRSNGIPTYTGKDIAYMMWKFGLLPEQLRICPYRLQANGQPLATTCPDGTFVQRTPPDEVINVVAEHQALQQQTVIEALRAAGYEQQAEHAHHLSYGMVSQAGSRISGRRGVGSSADDVITEAVAVAHERVREKQPALSEEERAQIAEAIGIGAIRYLMVQYNPVKAIEFNIEDVVSFEGNTGLYLQYALVRMHAILRKAREEFGLDESAIRAGDAQLLTSKQERELILRLARFPSAIADAMRTLNVNLVADYAHSLASTFSQFYRDCPVLSAEPEVRMARLHLVLATRDVLCNAANVLGVPIVERL
jgi:arginyl-tRNA synthetase